MEYLTALLIIALVLYLVINPFFSNRRDWNPDELKDDLDEVTKEQVFITLNELEMEYNMGKLPEKDFKRMKKQYEALAIEKVKEERELSQSDINHQEDMTEGVTQLERDIEREIEEELKELRGKRGNEK